MKLNDHLLGKSRWGGRRVALVICLWLLAGLACEPDRESSIEPGAADNEDISDTEAIRHLIEEYARSIDETDPALASQVWAREEEISFIHPRGHEHGFGQILENFYRKTIWSRFDQRKLSIRDRSIKVTGNTAWAEFSWEFTAVYKENGQSLQSQGRETQIFHKEIGSGWRLVHIHYSSMP